MPSPFPGMNPYLEQETVWHDFHQSFIPVARELLTKQVRPRFVVKVEEHLYVEEVPAGERRLAAISDVAVVGVPGAATGTAAAVAEAPAYFLLPVDVEQESYLEIRDRESNQLVTVIELLSPTNKRHSGRREQYLAKRRALMASTAHLVEIDLLRGGPRMPPEGLPDCDYYAIVSRVEERPRNGIWPLRLRDALPKIPVPLRPPHPDALLDLKEALDRVYDAAGYADYIYRGAPHPPLHPDDAAWARQFIPS